MLRLYGTAEQFLSVFNPALQLTAARHVERAYRGTAPQLATVSAGYGEPVAVVWLCIQIENVNVFAGVKEKMSVERQKELAGLILAEYDYLKVTELLLFFHRLKCGRYGRFYGTVDALFIASSLLAFLDERRKDLARCAADDEQRRQAAKAASAALRPAASGGITYDEYLLLKKRKQADSSAQQREAVEDFSDNLQQSGFPSGSTGPVSDLPAQPEPMAGTDNGPTTLRPPTAPPTVSPTAPPTASPTAPPTAPSQQVSSAAFQPPDRPSYLSSPGLSPEDTAACPDGLFIE